jgi:hypothetical protein
MTQFNAPTPRRASGDIDVYTGLLGAAMLVLAAAVFLIATANMKHSTQPNQDNGGMFTIVPKR